MGRGDSGHMARRVGYKSSVAIDLFLFSLRKVEL